MFEVEMEQMELLNERVEKIYIRFYTLKYYFIFLNLVNECSKHRLMN